MEVRLHDEMSSLANGSENLTYTAEGKDMIERSRTCIFLKVCTEYNNTYQASVVTCNDSIAAARLFCFFSRHFVSACMKSMRSDFQPRSLTYRNVEEARLKPVGLISSISAARQARRLQRHRVVLTFFSPPTSSGHPGQVPVSLERLRLISMIGGGRLKANELKYDIYGAYTGRDGVSRL